MAHGFYVTIEGTKQGKFKGESQSAAHKDAIIGLRFSYDVKSARDVATGQASGKRQHSPVTITKEWGAATPQIYQALITNEVLKTVLLEFVQTNPDGVEEVYFTITLNNATVSEIRQYTGEETTGANRDAQELEEVSFTFQKITLEDKPGKTSVVDDWTK